MAFRLALLDEACRATPRCCSSPPRRPAGARRCRAGRARGVALHESFGSIVAQVVEASLADGRPRVHRVVCAADIGTVVNPGIVAQQMESAIVFGLGAALYGRIDIDDGVVRQTNFPELSDRSRWPTRRAIETHLVASTRAPGGVGETGTPPLAPALANALVRADRQAPARAAADCDVVFAPRRIVVGRPSAASSLAACRASACAQLRRVDRLGQEVVHAGGQRLRRARDTSAAAVSAMIGSCSAL